MSPRRIVVCCLLLSSLWLSLASPGAAQKLKRPSCKVGSNAPRASFWTWVHGSRVKVYLRGKDFTGEETSVISPLESWNKVSGLTNSGVMFEYAGSTEEPQACNNCLTIMRGSVLSKRKQHTAADLIAYSDGDQMILRATIVIAPALKNLTELSEVVAHELGHTFGLFDCYTCADKTTLMNQFKGLDSPNGLASPTPCDIAQVAANYRDVLARTLAAKARRKTLQVDDGEEPVEDDTPIIVPVP